MDVFVNMNFDSIYLLKLTVLSFYEVNIVLKF